MHIVRLVAASAELLFAPEHHFHRTHACTAEHAGQHDSRPVRTCVTQVVCYVLADYLAMLPLKWAQVRYPCQWACVAFSILSLIFAVATAAVHMYQDMA